MWELDQTPHTEPFSSGLWVCDWFIPHLSAKPVGGCPSSPVLIQQTPLFLLKQGNREACTGLLCPAAQRVSQTDSASWPPPAPRGHMAPATLPCEPFPPPLFMKDYGRASFQSRSDIFAPNLRSQTPSSLLLKTERAVSASGIFIFPLTNCYLLILGFAKYTHAHNTEENQNDHGPSTGHKHR